MDLEKKVILITGGSIGIGRRLCEVLAGEKALLSICDVDQTNGEELVTKLIKENGVGSAIFTKCDVVDQDALRECFKKTKAHFGRIDVVVNNAGFWNDNTKWQSMVDVNIKGVINGSLLAMEFMGVDKGGEGGTVINVASVVGFHSLPYVPIYSATKAAVLMFTRNMGYDMHFKNSHIKFVAVCPHGTAGSCFFDSMEEKFMYKSQDFLDGLQVLSQLFQTVENVAVGMKNVIKQGSNGSVWLIENGEPEKEIHLKDHEIVLPA